MIHEPQLVLNRFGLLEMEVTFELAQPKQRHAQGIMEMVQC